MSNSEEKNGRFRSKTGLTRIVSATANSFDGLKTAWRNESAFRQELMAAIPAAIIALLLPLSALEKLALIAVLILVLLVEIVNSAIEAAVDRVSLERHPLAKNAKDLGSAAVCLALLIAGLTWAVIVLPLVFA